MYFFINVISRDRFKNIVSHFNEHFIQPHTHGNDNRTSNRSNIFKADEEKKVVTYIQNLAG